MAAPVKQAPRAYLQALYGQAVAQGQRALQLLGEAKVQACTRVIQLVLDYWRAAARWQYSLTEAELQQLAELNRLAVRMEREAQHVQPPLPPPPPAASPPRRDSSRRRSTLACPACKSLRRGSGGAAAPLAALECPLCFCEVDTGDHMHLDCGHAACNACLANWLHASYQNGQHPACQHPNCKQLLSAEDLQQGVLVLCGCADVAQQRARAGLPPLDDAAAVHQRFTDLAAAAVARGAGGELIECQHCHFRMLAEQDAPDDALCPNCRMGRPILE